MIGRVLSTKSKNTATVLVERLAMHPLYKKTYLRSKKYLVDNQLGVKEGDVVEIVNCKPVSKRKNWKIVKVVGKSLEEITKQKLKEAAKEVIAEVIPEPSSAEASEGKEEKVVMDNSAEKPTRPSNGGKSKKKGRTELSKTKNGTAQK